MSIVEIRTYDLHDNQETIILTNYTPISTNQNAKNTL